MNDIDQYAHLSDEELWHLGEATIEITLDGGADMPEEQIEQIIENVILLLQAMRVKGQVEGQFIDDEIDRPYYCPLCHKAFDPEGFHRRLFGKLGEIYKIGR